MKSWNDSLADKFVKPVVKVKLSGNTSALLSNALFVVSILGVLPYLILIWKVEDTQKTGGLVLNAFYLGVIISLTWMLYGIFVLKNVIVILSSFLILLAKAYLIYVIIKARGGGADGNHGAEEENYDGDYSSEYDG